MAVGLPRSNRKQVPRTFSPVYSSVWPFCRSFTPEQIRTNQHPRKSLKVQNQFPLNKLHSASKIAFQSPKSTLINLFTFVVKWRCLTTTIGTTDCGVRITVRPRVEQGSYCTWDNRILLDQVPFQNSGTTCLDGEFDKYFLVCRPPKRKGKDRTEKQLAEHLPKSHKWEPKIQTGQFLKQTENQNTGRWRRFSELLSVWQLAIRQ